jgi:uncharacterized membrane protein YphA (DoxX/SURF4 family)
MNILKKTKTWGDTHHPKILDLIRILLGTLLCIRAYVYFNNAGYIRELIVTNQIIRQSPEVVLSLIYYSTYIQVVCGSLILIGLQTRLAALVIFPLIFGAVFFINILNPYFNAELWLSVLVMVLLALFVVIGSGPWSLDRLLSKLTGGAST